MWIWPTTAGEEHYWMSPQMLPTATCRCKEQLETPDSGRGAPSSCSVPPACSTDKTNIMVIAKEMLKSAAP